MCQGCFENFCRINLPKHLQTFGEQLDQIEKNHDQFRQKNFLINKKRFLKKRS